MGTNKETPTLHPFFLSLYETTIQTATRPLPKPSSSTYVAPNPKPQSQQPTHLLSSSPPITHPRNSNTILHAAIRPPCQISAMSPTLRVLTVRVGVDVERRVSRVDLRGGVWRWEGGSGADAT